MIRFKKMTLTVGLAIAAVVAVGFQSTGIAAQADQLWSIAVHFEYDSGFEFDYVLRTGVPAAEVHEVLQDCGRSHRTPSVVRYHCYAIPE